MLVGGKAKRLIENHPFHIYIERDNFCVCEIISKNPYTREGTVISKALALKNLRWQFASERNWTQQKCLLLVSSLCYLCHECAISPWLCSQWLSKYMEQGSKPQKTRALKTAVVICPQGEIQTIIHRDSDDFRYLDCQPAVNLQSPLELFIKINRGWSFSGRCTKTDLSEWNTECPDNPDCPTLCSIGWLCYCEQIFKK